MNFLHFSYVTVIITQVSTLRYSLSCNISNNSNKKLEKQVKQLSRKIQKLEKENSYQQNKIKMLHQMINIVISLTISVARAYAETMKKY